MAALGFGIDGCAATTGADCFLGSVLWARCAVVVATGFDRGAGAFATDLFAASALPARVLLTLGFGAGFFADTESSFFCVNSNAGLGRVRSCGPVRVSSAAGFTPAAAAALAAEAESADFRGFPSISGLTMT